MKTKKLCAYMKARAEFEKQIWGLDEEYLEGFFNDPGVRTFFGVEIDDKGNLLKDAAQPAFFRMYHELRAQRN